MYISPFVLGWLRPDRVQINARAVFDDTGHKALRKIDL